MLCSRSARWSGIGISNGRFRIGVQSPQTRNICSAGLRAQVPRSQIQNTVRNSTLRTFHSVLRSRAPLVLSSTRFASTQSYRPVSALSEEASTSASDSVLDVSPSDDLLSEVSQSADPVAVSSVADGTFGYLASIGLEHGYGPTLLMQNVLEAAHVFTDYSWVGSVVILAVMTRAIMFPFIWQSHASTARLAPVRPQIKLLTDQLREALSMQDTAKMTQAKQQQKQLYARVGASPWDPAKPVLAQMVMGFGTWRTLHGMCELPVPAVKEESFLWLTDLTMRDPYFLLPILQSIIIYYNIKSGAEAGGANPNENPMMTGAMKNLQYLSPVFAGVFMAVQPGLIQANFLMTSILMALIGAALRQPRIRSMLALPPMRPKPVNDGNTLNLVEDLTPTQTGGRSTPTYVYDKSAAAAAQRARADQARAAAEAAEFGDDASEDKNFLDRAIRGVKRVTRRVRNSATVINAKEQQAKRGDSSRMQQRKERERAYEERRKSREREMLKNARR